MSAPRKVYTLETLLARTVEVGDCMEWTGYSRNGSPQVKLDGRMTTVRRAILILKGTPAHPNEMLSTRCGNPQCVNPDHIIERSIKQHMTHMGRQINHQHPLRIAKLQKAAAARRIIDDEKVLQILNDPRRAQDVADDLGVSKSLVTKIRRGKSYKQINAAVNPWAGLMR